MTEVEEKTEFMFSELEESAKQTAREAYTSGEYPGYDWWDDVYADAERMASMLGITFDSEVHKTMGGKSLCKPQISFSGFYCQGSGACFSGNYAFALDSVAKISAETNDKELIRIAEQLTLLQTTRRLLGHALLTASIVERGSYSHSGSMQVEVNSEDEEDEHCQINPDEEDEVTQLMRDFANWIYAQLEAENDYLYSDEYIDDQLAEDKFDEFGNVI